MDGVYSLDILGTDYRIPFNTKLKSKVAGFAGLGVGYNIIDNFRADITFACFFNLEYKDSETKIFKISNYLITQIAYLKTKASINTFVLNGYIDIFDAGFVKFFFDEGVGLTQIKRKINYTFSVVDKNTNPLPT